MNWIKVFDQEILLHNDFITAVNVKRKRLCIVKSGENFFAAQSKCPHAGADLSRGWCKKEKLICPYHRYEYDLHSGMAQKGRGITYVFIPYKSATMEFILGLKKIGDC